MLQVSAFFWIVIGVLIIAALADSGKKSTASKGRPTRIDHPHYFDEDDHECSVCGTRFRGKSMTCPKCGAKFIGIKEDDGEFMEEMVIWDDEDDDD